MNKLSQNFFLLLFIFLWLCISPQQSFTYDFSKIDEYALKTPKSAEKSIKTLAAYLIKPAKNDLEKVRVIYRWVTANISYDTEAFFSGNYGSTSANDVLKNKSSICEGYSGLFSELAKAAGIEVVKIGGYAKGYGYKVGDNLNGPTNHAWNAVKLAGKWYLLDSTWGAGYVDNNSKFVRSYKEYYFLTPPGNFIYDHLPEDEKWQLLDKPITKKEYEEMPFLKATFFDDGLKLISHKKSIIQTDSQLEVVLSAPDDVLLLTSLEQKNNKLDNLTFVQREKDQFKINVIFPKAGEYTLRIFAKRKSEKEMYNWAMDYKIITSSGNSGEIGFPLTYSSFGEHSVYIYSPLNGKLKLQSKQTFKLSVDNADAVAVVVGNEWIHLTKNGNIFAGEVTINNKEVVVYAKFPGESSYSGLMKYEGY